MNRPISYSRDQLEEFSTKYLLDLKSKWSIYIKAKYEISYEEMKFLKKEAKNQISIIREIINNRGDI